MRQSRRRRGFERAGKVPAGRLGLPARRVRDLSLLQGWCSVAGEALSRHARALAVVRGVLEIETADRRWHDAVLPLLPQLAARLAHEQPALGVKRFRLHLVGEPEAPATQLVPEFVDEGYPRPASPFPRGARPAAAPATRDELERRLERLAGRYVRRVDRQKA